MPGTSCAERLSGHSGFLRLWTESTIQRRFLAIRGETIQSRVGFARRDWPEDALHPDGNPWLVDRVPDQPDHYRADAIERHRQLQHVDQVFSR